MKRLVALFLLVCSFGYCGVPSVKSQELSLNKYMRKWQVKLGLEDAVILLEVVSAKQLPEGAVGLSEEYVDPPICVISVLKEQEYKLSSDYQDVKKDQKNTVVHELLHLLFQIHAEEYNVVMLSNLLSPQPPRQ